MTRTTGRTGFTLIEIMIVVVILGILAAIVIPLVAESSTDAVKAALARQLQTIDNQMEIYKANNQNALPTDDPTSPLGGADNNGWGVLVSAQYLKEEPINGYTGTTGIQAGTETAAIAIVPPSAVGWMYEVDAAADRINVFAAGFDEATKTLSNE